MMPATISYTVEDLLTLELPPGVAHFELSHGELIPAGSAGAEHEFLKATISRILTRYCDRSGGFDVLPESSFALGPSTSRQPDVAVVTHARFRQLRKHRGPILFAPDLAVEVVSLSEKEADSTRKVRQYLAAGTTEVWQIFLASETLVIHRADGPAQEFARGDRAESQLLTGFSVVVSEFFD